MAELLVWPILVAYGEAAVAFFGNARRPGTYGLLATWGVRLGWVAQTGLLAVQAVRANGFPWDTWAGSLNLFVWLVVGAYLIWGCRARFRLLGLGVMPLVFGLLLLAWAGGGTAVGSESRYPDLFLVLHVGLVLAAFAGFTLAAALSGLYLWQEHQLKRHEGARMLRLRAPSLVSLDATSARTIAVALPALTLGIGAGLARLASEGGELDPLMIFTGLAWLVYALFLVVRYGLGWHGRRAAMLVLLGFALVILVRIGLPVTHFS
ncbi:MAG: cytochrome c biogenesis protein CcsA [Actinobacteria bacterium]|nr:cytochrome c biogenesis protein CcsA [Actinomycetota bacterium]